MKPNNQSEEVTAEYRQQYCFNVNAQWLPHCSMYLKEGCPECCGYAFLMIGRTAGMGEDSGLAERLNQEKEK